MLSHQRIRSTPRFLSIHIRPSIPMETYIERYGNIKLIDKDSFAYDWIARLSESKQIGLQQLLCKNLVQAFDDLLPFPGLWAGLELGNIQRLLATHCDEVIACESFGMRL